MVQKISILALAVLASAMICPAQAADPATPAQVADDPASSESSIGESIGGFFKQLGKGIENTVKKIDQPGGYSEKDVVARGWINNNLWVCKKDNPKPILVGNGRGVTVDPTIVAAANSCDNLIKKGMLQRVAGASGTGTGANLSADGKGAEGESVFQGCKIIEIRRNVKNGTNVADCFTPSGIYVGYETRRLGHPPVFTPREDEKGDHGRYGNGYNGYNGGSHGVRSSGADPEAWEKIKRDAAKEIARIDAEGRRNDAKSQAMFSREAAKQQKAGTQELQVELKKQLDEIQRTGEENLRKAKAKGLAPN